MVSIFTVDAFTETPFSGNPAGVCIVPRADDDSNNNRKWSLSDKQMQNIATEMNISETSFITFHERTLTNVWELRWMTPTVEVNLCGHGTLSAAAIIFQEYGDKVGNSILFHTLSGILIAEKNLNTGKIKMTLPNNPPVIVSNPSAIHKQIFQCMNFNMDDFQELAYSMTTKKLLICLNNFNRTKLEALKPNIDGLTQIDQTNEIASGNNVKGVIITFKIDETNNQQDDDGNTSIKYDFLSRYFAPWVGIPEDPVTGSAHTVLTPYWSTKFNGQKNFVARQCSKRGGDLSLTLNDNDNKVYISGHACVVMSGKLNIV